MGLQVRLYGDRSTEPNSNLVARWKPHALGQGLVASRYSGRNNLGLGLQGQHSYASLERPHLSGGAAPAFGEKEQGVVLTEKRDAESQTLGEMCVPVEGDRVDERVRNPAGDTVPNGTPVEFDLTTTDKGPRAVKVLVLK